MSAEQNTPNTEPAPIPRPPMIRVLGMLIVFLATAVFAVSYMGNLRERAADARSETLTEKYRVKIESIDPVLRNAEPVTWSVDGSERECVLSTGTDTLRCEDETGTLVEVGK